MANLLDPKTMKLVQAIDEFMENPPRDLPEGLPEQLKELGTGLRGYGDSDDLSPGQKEAAKVTGESYEKVATSDRSPGQREFDRAMEAAKEVFAGAAADNPAGT